MASIWSFNELKVMTLLQGILFLNTKLSCIESATIGIGLQMLHSSNQVFLPPPPVASLTGMLASQLMGLGVPPPSTTIVDACTPWASAAEGDNMTKINCAR